MSKLDQIQAALERGYDYRAEQAEEHVALLLAVVDAVLSGQPLEQAIEEHEEWAHKLSERDAVSPDVERVIEALGALL